jgi:hypothetical protein
MAAKNSDSVYSIAFDERDAEILRLEKMRITVTADIEKTVAELAKLTSNRRLIGRKVRIDPIIADGTDLDKL